MTKINIYLSYKKSLLDKVLFWFFIIHVWLVFGLRKDKLSLVF